MTHEHEPMHTPECWLLQGFLGQMSKNYLYLKERVKMYHL